MSSDSLKVDSYIQNRGFGCFWPFTSIPYHPWDERYIYLHEWLILMVNVGKYNGMGIIIGFRRSTEKKNRPHQFFTR